MTKSKSTVPVKMLVNTDQTNYSGNQGGVPVFSRVGKQTIAESLCFQNPDKHDVLSTFQQEKLRLHEEQNEETDNDDDFKDMQTKKQEMPDMSKIEKKHKRGKT